ncbi:hypothetical protein ACU8KH_01105 [Lachancea thermotolerans]
MSSGFPANLWGELGTSGSLRLAGRPSSFPRHFCLNVRDSKLTVCFKDIKFRAIQTSIAENTNFACITTGLCQLAINIVGAAFQSMIPDLCGAKLDMNYLKNSCKKKYSPI